MNVNCYWLAVFLLAAVTTATEAQSSEARKTQYNLRKGVALAGYDPVSYFSGNPAEGDEELVHQHEGVTYFFATAANREQFRKNPGRFEPAYGGWCAYAMGASGEKVKVDPETFKIIGDRLYLFYNFWGNNTLDAWNRDEIPLHRKADQNWKKFVP